MIKAVTKALAALALVLGLSSAAQAQQYYVEFTLTSSNITQFSFGLVNSGFPTTTGNTIGQDAAGNSVGVQINTSVALIKGVNVGTVPNIPSGHTVGIAVDFTHNNIWFRDTASPAIWNNGTANPSNNTGGISFATVTCPCYAAVTIFDGAGVNVATADFGATPYAAPIPAGFGNWPGSSTPANIALTTWLINALSSFSGGKFIFMGSPYGQ